MGWRSREARKGDYETRKLIGVCAHCARRARPGLVTCGICAEKDAKRAARRWKSARVANQAKRSVAAGPQCLQCVARIANRPDAEARSVDAAARLKGKEEIK